MVQATLLCSPLQLEASSACSCNQSFGFYNFCMRRTDCKNMRYWLPIARVNKGECRSLHGHCKMVRFCSEPHMKLCRQKIEKSTPKTIRRGREPLTIQQLAHLFHTLVNSIGAPWAAVLVLCQLATGERADCARRMDISWLRNLAPDSASLPTITIPQVSKKTVPRTIPLPAGLV